MTKKIHRWGVLRQTIPKLHSPIQNRLLLGCYAAMVIFGWWVPNDLLEYSPALGAFTDFMASIVPQIDRVTTLGGVTAGNANRVLYSALWAVGIVLGVVNVIAVVKERSQIPEGRGPQESIWKKIFYTTVGCYLIVGEGLYMHSLRPELRLVKFSLVNRFGAGLWAPLLTVGISVLIIGGVGICVVTLIDQVRKLQWQRNSRQ